MNWQSILLIFCIIVFLDKTLTVANILLVNKNFPDAMKEDPYKIERNPLAHWFFTKLGLVGGTIIYFIISVGTLYIAYYLLRYMLPNHALYIILMLYGLVIANNFYFMFKYAKVIP